MQWIDQFRISLIFGAIAIALVAIAPSATAGDADRGHVTGEDRLQHVDVSRQALVLEDLTVKIVTATRIYDGDNRRIALRQIQDPAPRAPVIVEYEGRLSNGVVEAKRVVVRLMPQ